MTAGIDPAATVNCTGKYFYYSNYHPGCLQYGHRGPVDLRTALEYSCNIFFYDTGRRLGVDTFSAMARQLGLANDTGVEITAAQGRLTWSTDTNYQDGLTLMAAIGQGNTAVTPLQLAQYAGHAGQLRPQANPAFCRPRRAACHRRSRVAVRAGFYRDPRRRSCVRPHPGWHEADGPDRPRPAGGPCYRCGQDRAAPSWPTPCPAGATTSTRC